MAKERAFKIEKYSGLSEKLVYISLFTILLYNLELLNSCSPIGYKVNIFDQVPSQFWFLLIITYVIGSFQLLQKPNSKFRYVGILALLINYVLFLLVPNRLSYFTVGNSDSLAYLGEICSIIVTSHTNINDIYPAAHIFYSATALISGFEAYKLSTLIPTYFSLIFVLGIIVFSKNYFGKNRFVSNNSLLFNLLIPVSIIYYLRYMHFSVAPNGTFFMLTPIFLLVIYKYTFTNKNKFSFSILTVVLSLIIPFSHPFIIVFISYILFILIISKNHLPKKTKTLLNLTLLLIAATTLWVISNPFYFHALEMYTHMSQTVAMNGMDTFQKASKVVNLSTMLKTIIFLYGRYIIPSVIIFIAIVKIFTSKYVPYENSYYLKNIFTKFIILYSLFFFFDIFLIVNPFLTHTLKRLTTLNFTIFAQIPLLALSLYYLFLDKNMKNSALMTSIILSVIFYLSVFGSLSSPTIYESNTGVTVNEVKGMQWWLEFKNETEHITSPLNPDIGARYSDLLQGWNHNEPTAITLPPHFGYKKNRQLEFKNLYIAIMGHDELLYSSVLVFEKNKEREGYIAEDFSRFRNDTGVQKIYDSLNIEIYKT